MPTLGEYLSGLGNIGLDEIFRFFAGVFVAMVFLYAYPFFELVKGFPLIRTINLNEIQQHLEETEPQEAAKFEAHRKEIQKQLMYRILAPIAFALGLCSAFAPLLGISKAYGVDFFMCVMYAFFGIVLLVKTDPLCGNDIKKYTAIFKELKKKPTETKKAEE